MMSGLKTKENDGDISAFIATVDNQQKQEDSYALIKMMETITGSNAKMWGTSIIGFGKYHYQNTGKGGSWPIVGFSPRKSNLSLYIMPGFSDYQPLMDKLGKHKTGKSCLYINKLADVDLDVLNALISSSVEHMRAKYDTEV